MMKKYLPILAAFLAFVIGVMAVLAGGPVLLGRDPGYFVISWLPVYNLTIGILSCFPIAFLIWKQHRSAALASAAVLGLNVLVFLILLAAYRQVVAAQSLVAMAIRIIVWIVILGLVWFGSRVKPRALN